MKKLWKYIVSSLYTEAKHYKVPSIYNIGESTKLNEICDNILKDNLYINKDYGYVLYNSSLWNEDESKDRSFNFKVQSLAFCTYLLSHYQKVNDEKYILKADEIIKEWFRYNFKNSDNKYVWHDHATALRLLVIIGVYSELKHLKKQSTTIYKKIIDKHLKKLVDPKFYRLNHNHGLDQDIAIYIASEICSGCMINKKYRDYLSLSRNRIEKQVNYLFLSDGSYAEHSPQYGWNVFLRLFHFYIFVEKYTEDKNMLEFINYKLKSSINYILFTLMPNGKIVPIGDSNEIRINYHLIEDVDKDLYNHFNYLYNEGKEGIKPSQKATFFEQGNFLTYNNTWNYNSNILKIYFYSSFNNRVHKHDDDLSVCLFYKDCLVLTDSGKYNYNYDDKYRQYVVSPYGHNTIIIDKKNFNTSIDNVGLSGLTEYYHDDNITFSCGLNLLDDDVLIRRLLLVIDDCIYIIDNVISKIEHLIETSFNFTNELEIFNVGNKITAHMNNEHYLTMNNIFSNQSQKVDYYRGSEELLKGFRSRKNNQIEANHLYVYKAKAKKILNIYKINIGSNYKCHNVVVNDEDNLTIGINNIKIKIDREVTITKDNKEISLVKNYHDKMKLKINKFYINQTKTLKS